jgi:hypothetical protein
MADLRADSSQVIDKAGLFFTGKTRVIVLAGLVLACGVLATAAPPQQPAAAPAPATSPQRALVNQYCMGCHNEKLKTAGLELNSANIDHVEQNPDVCRREVAQGSRALHAAAWPSRPDEKTTKASLCLETSLDRAPPQPNPAERNPAPPQPDRVSKRDSRPAFAGRRCHGASPQRRFELRLRQHHGRRLVANIARKVLGSSAKDQSSGDWRTD